MPRATLSGAEDDAFRFFPVVCARPPTDCASSGKSSTANFCAALISSAVLVAFLATGALAFFVTDAMVPFPAATLASCVATFGFFVGALGFELVSLGPGPVVCSTCQARIHPRTNQHTSPESLAAASAPKPYCAITSLILKRGGSSWIANEVEVLLCIGGLVDAADAGIVGGFVGSSGIVVAGVEADVEGGCVDSFCREENRA